MLIFMGIWNIFREKSINTVASNSPQFIRNIIYKIMKFGNETIKIRKKCFFVNPDHMRFGKNVFINRGCRFYNCSTESSLISIGDNVAIGFGTSIISSTHYIGSSSCRADYREPVGKKVIIGNGVWICANCIILPGVTIGDGCVIGAGAVVTKSTLPNGMYVGNPAKLIKELS